MSVVGFDFGNSSCTIAVAQKGGIDVITNEVSSRQTPCMAAFGDKERYLGEPALTQYLRNIKNTVVNIKCLIGRKWNEPEVQEEMKSLPFKTVELPNQNIGIEVMYAGERKVFSVVSVAAMILQKLKVITEKATQKSCCDVVISVPGYWTEHQRRALLDASKVAGLSCLRLMNETAASALAYGFYKTNLSETEPIRAMFVDMGHTATSVSIVEFVKGKLKVIATAYDRKLGGRNFDQVLVDHFAKEFKEKYKIDVRTNQKALIRLDVMCEKLKKLLNTVPEAPINIDSIMNDIDVKGMMKRSEFEAMVAPLLDKLVVPIQQVLNATGMTPEQLFAVEITGGATRLSAVQAKLAEFLKRDISKTLNFEESVSRGCALQCAMLSPVFRVKEFHITDIYNYPVKVSWKNSNSMAVEGAQGNTLEIPKLSPVPAAYPIAVQHRLGDPLEVVAEYSDNSVPAGTPALISRFVLPSIPNKPDPLPVKLFAKVDINGCFVIENGEVSETIEEVVQKTEPKTETPATDVQMGEAEAKPEEEKKPEKKTITRKTTYNVQSYTSSLPKVQIDSLTEEENKMVASDKLAIETAERKNAVETYVYDMRNKVSDSLSEYTTETERETFSKMLDDAESWLYNEGEDVTKSVYVAKLEELRRVGDPIVKRKIEYEGRFEAVMQIRNTIEQFRMAATSEDPKYDHITPEEKAKVSQECATVEKYIQEQMAKQDKIPKHANPVLTIADIQKRQQELTRFAQSILNKPKPKPEPKPEEKKEEKKEEAAKPDEQKASEGEKKGDTKQSEGGTKKDEMDLD